jgi:hypothetical protein
MRLAEASVGDIDDWLAVGVGLRKPVNALDLSEGPPGSRWIVTHHSGRGLGPQPPLPPVSTCWRKVSMTVFVQVAVQPVLLQIGRMDQGWLYIAFQSALETAGRPASEEPLVTPPAPVAAFCAATFASAA